MAKYKPCLISQIIFQYWWKRDTFILNVLELIRVWSDSEGTLDLALCVCVCITQLTGSLLVATLLSK